MYEEESCPLKEIAVRARVAFESGLISKDELKALYQHYNPLPDIDLFIERAKALFPRLNCGLASVYVHKRLPGSKVIKGRYAGHNHTFVLVDDAVVVDITADQYGGPRVYVGPLERPWSK